MRDKEIAHLGWADLKLKAFATHVLNQDTCVQRGRAP